MRKTIWRNRNWRLFWLGQSISIIGDTVFDVTVLLWVGRVIALHRSWAPAAASGVLIAAAIPTALVGPFAGVFVDRWNRRTTMLVADAARMLLVVGLIPLAFPVVARHLPAPVQLATVYLVVAFAACFSQFFNPSRFAMLGVIVAAEEVPQASGLLQSSTYTALIIGPPLAAPLLFVAGVQWALIINATSFGISFLTIWLVHIAGTPPAASRDTSAPSSDYWREFRVGLKFFISSRVLLALAAGLILVALGAGVLGALNVFFIQANLHQSASLYGTIGLAEGVGGLLGGLITGWIIVHFGAPRVFWGGLILSGFAIIGYSRMSNLFAALAFITAVGFLLGGVGASNSTLLLAVTPQQMIGRVMSVITPLAYLAAIISLAAAGILTSTVLHGLRVTIAGITFGPYDTVIGVAGVLFVVAGLASIRPLNGQSSCVSH